MRKAVWCGAAGMVAFAVVVYVAACQAVAHPESYWGRCIGAAAQLGVQGNPFVVMNPVAGNPVLKEFAQHVGAAVGCGLWAEGGVAQARCEIVKPEGEPAENLIAHDPEPEAAVIVDPFEPIQVEVVPDGGFVVSGLITPAFPETEEPRTGAAEESEPALEQPMPEEQAPVAMPYADEQPEAVKDCHEDGSCDGWLWRLLEKACIVRDITEEAELVPMPVHDGEEPQEQGTEGANKESADQGSESESHEPMPGCQEDPAYQHHYHGCPYMGCPYPYSHSRPIPGVVPTEEQPQTKTDAVKKKLHRIKKKPASTDGAWKKKMFWFQEDFSSQSSTDTMEFRPSDDPRESPGNVPF
jgi:hypothetical protein